MATTPAKKTPAKTPAKPQDRQPSRAALQREEKKRQQMVAEYLAAGLDLSDFTIDAGDGIEWHFTPDPMPAETAAMVRAMDALEKAGQDIEGIDDFDRIEEATNDLIALIQKRMTIDKQRKEFPKPNYGAKAIQWFAMHLVTGRDGFPTVEA